MKTRSNLSLFLFLALLSTSFYNCSTNKKAAKVEEQQVAAQPTGPQLELNGDSDSQKAGPLKTVFFAYDSSELSYESKAVLESNAAFLKASPKTVIQIEGHCDERGSVQYNLGLGDRRANATKNYLLAQGVSASQITTVSFGKERPLEFGHDEPSWSKNRRANFVITAL